MITANFHHTVRVTVARIDEDKSALNMQEADGYSGAVFFLPHHVADAMAEAWRSATAPQAAEHAGVEL